jgi:hypothetical protein
MSCVGLRVEGTLGGSECLAVRVVNSGRPCVKTRKRISTRARQQKVNCLRRDSQIHVSLAQVDVEEKEEDRRLRREEMISCKGGMKRPKSFEKVRRG